MSESSKPHTHIEEAGVGVKTRNQKINVNRIKFTEIVGEDLCE